MRAKVDADMCIGCGMCASTAPEIYQMNEEGKAEAYAGFDEEKEASAREAMDGCPVGAISIEQ